MKSSLLGGEYNIYILIDFATVSNMGNIFYILIIHEVAKDHLSLTNIQYETI